MLQNVQIFAFSVANFWIPPKNVILDPKKGVGGVPPLQWDEGEILRVFARFWGFLGSPP